VTTTLAALMVLTGADALRSLSRSDRGRWRGGYVRSSSKVDAVPVEAKASCADLLCHTVLNERAEMINASQTATLSSLP
jgi:hypothetical protein